VVERGELRCVVEDRIQLTMFRRVLTRRLRRT